ncbi:DUF547 domain-containing protein [Polaribacter sp.]|uniref:DUF547 domain-containing protein n=1 Tax=Polaribacter sp. TaxID=1920175 RepID=UPI004047564B
MKNFLLIFLLIFIDIQMVAQANIFNELLQKHVSEDGLVDYAAFKKELPKLNQYLQYLEKTSLDDTWSSNQQKAFYINGYNAYTIALILENYPLKSILDIKQNNQTAWKIPFVKIGGKTMTLDFLEHEILRKKFDDPRIHVGVNCASISCPKLSNVAFTEQNIETELERLMLEFVNDSSKNNISKDIVKISAIFDWFKADFTKNSSLIAFLNQYSKVKINPNAKIQFLEYDWNINKQ